MALDIQGPKTRLSDDSCDLRVVEMALRLPDAPILKELGRALYGDTTIEPRRVTALRAELVALKNLYIKEVGEPLARKQKLYIRDDQERDRTIEKLLTEDPCFLYITRFIAICDDAFQENKAITISGD